MFTEVAGCFRRNWFAKWRGVCSVEFGVGVVEETIGTAMFVLTSAGVLPWQEKRAVDSFTSWLLRT